MKLVKTNDNSYTFFNSEFQEYYHSCSGALEEAQKKFVEQVDLKEGMHILDICFGLGYNSYMALKAKKDITIVGLEIDATLFKEVQNIAIDETFKKIQKAMQDALNKIPNKEINLILADARESIKSLSQEFDAVFLDPFSPKVNPELWTKEFFQDIFDRMKPGAKLATYSCARVVRDNLKKVGFKISDGIKLHRRGPSTIATKPNVQQEFQ